MWRRCVKFVVDAGYGPPERVSCRTPKWTVAKLRCRRDGTSTLWESILVLADFYSRFYEVAILGENPKC